MDTKKETEKKKKLKHVKVYDRLYEQIQNETYPVDSQLPAETALAEIMGVSRMTLRKALALLVEDGLVKNIPGVGHFVRPHKAENDHFLDLSKKIAHPIYSYCTESPDATEFEYRIEPPTRPILDTLQQYTPAVVIADRWYKKNSVPFAYSLSFLPIECIAKKQIDLNEKTELLTFLESVCYEESAVCHRICSHSTTGNFTAQNYSLSHHDSFLLIQETICDKEGTIFVSSKHYIPSELYRIEITLE